MTPSSSSSTLLREGDDQHLARAPAGGRSRRSARRNGTGAASGARSRARSGRRRARGRGRRSPARSRVPAGRDRLDLDAELLAERARLVERGLGARSSASGIGASIGWSSGTRTTWSASTDGAVLGRELDRGRGHLLADDAELHRHEDPAEARHVVEVHACRARPPARSGPRRGSGARRRRRRAPIASQAAPA